ncbi:MAG: hypothetical protein ACKO37_02955 [Vampirovibrionales bacterium]
MQCRLNRWLTGGFVMGLLLCAMPLSHARVLSRVPDPSAAAALSQMPQSGNAGVPYPPEGANLRVMPMPRVKPVPSHTSTSHQVQQPPVSLNPWLPYAQDIPLMKALHLLSVCPLPEAQEALRSIAQHRSRLLLKVLATLSPNYARYDALSWIAPEGKPYLFIAERHRHAPPQALAALIAHEALHDDLTNSVEEEIEGWTREATVWHYFQTHPETTLAVQDPLRHTWWYVAQQEHLSSDALALRPPKKGTTTKQWDYIAPHLPEENALVKRLMILEKAWQQGALPQMVAQNAGYQALPRTRAEASQHFSNRPSTLPAASPEVPEASQEYTTPPFLTTVDK